MANIDHHAPGAFCWIELVAPDQTRAKSFYTSLFGWSVTDFPMGPSEVYSMFSIDGRNTGAAYRLDHEKMPGLPPHWDLYVSVESADATTAKAVQAGGKLVNGPFDVCDFGRMAVLQDPAGAYINLWQPKSHHGIGVHAVPGTFCWADLSTPEPSAVKPFYETVFGWKISPGAHDPTANYLHIQNGEHHIGGIPPGAYHPANVPPHWLLYFLVDDADAATEKASKLGARVLRPAKTMENVGRWSVIMDPNDAALALFQTIEHK